MVMRETESSAQHGIPAFGAEQPLRCQTWPDSGEDFLNPLGVLERAGARKDVVEGLVVPQGVTWFYGASMSFKSFILIDMASAIAAGRRWLGRDSTQAVVIYLGAEGGHGLHIRRAAADLAAGGRAGPLCVIQDRPMLDTALGCARLRGIIQGLTRRLVGDDFEKGAFETTEDSFDMFVQENELERPDHSLDEEEARAWSHARKADPCKWEYGVALTDYMGGLDVFVTIPRKIVVFIDTFSQTSSDDTKHTVSAYVKNLRDMIDEAARNGWELTFIVVDHVTKEGSTYLGSVAKLNDVDSQIEIVRAGESQLATLRQQKMKDGPESAPIHVEVVPYAFTDHCDGYGQPLSTLVVQDGRRGAAIARVAAGKAALLLRLLDESGGALNEGELRMRFKVHPDNAEVKPASVEKSYRRGKADLLTEEVIETDGDMIRWSRPAE
jgi:hypothetical protein